MSLIVVIEDDAGTRLLISQVLRTEGYEVFAAEDGVKGLALIHEHHPAVVVSDVQMPLIDGFEVLDQIRNDAALAATAVILLTSLQDRSSMRQGMSTGADDYLTKPFSPQELREAVSAQINKRVRAAAMHGQVLDQAVQMALQEQRHTIGELYELRMLNALSEPWPTDHVVLGTEKLTSATVLFAAMHHYSLWAQALSSDELSALVQQLYSSVGDTVYLFGAHTMQFVGDGMLCVFVDGADTESVNHGLRAVRAALGLAGASARMNSYVRQHFGERDLPPFSLGVALHSGPVAFVRLDGPRGNAGQITPVGDTVALALKLFDAEPTLDWTIAASMQAARLVTGTVRTGRRALLHLPERSKAVDAVEILGLA
ncbi:hypothetical protein AwPolaro_00840 [Polaromonas sp.]|nr:hypothetical protein AwPolaro_00840 [Polaromonas sp.]